MQLEDVTIHYVLLKLNRLIALTVLSITEEATRERITMATAKIRVTYCRTLPKALIFRISTVYYVKHALIH